MKYREFWITKGTPDIIADTREEMRGCLKGDIGRIGCEIIHVIEASALDAANKRIAELEAALKNISAISYGTESLWEDAEWLEWYSKEVGRLKDIAKSALNTKSGSKT